LKLVQRGRRIHLKAAHNLGGVAHNCVCMTHAALRACLLPGALSAAGTYLTNAALAAGGVGLTQAIKATEPLAVYDIQGAAPALLAPPSAYHAAGGRPAGGWGGPVRGVHAKKRRRGWWWWCGRVREQPPLLPGGNAGGGTPATSPHV
jgi:hypothetical protein